MTTPEFTQFMQSMASFPLNTSAVQDAFKTSAAFGEKMSKVALEVAEKSTDISAKWAKDTIHKLGTFTTSKEVPADYIKAMTELASTSAEAAAEHLAAYADVAKKAQAGMLEVMLTTSKTATEDATAAVKKVAEDATAMVKKATEDVTATAKKSSNAAK